MISLNMDNEHLLEFAQNMISKADDTGTVEGMQVCMLTSIACSLLVLARK